MSFTDAELLAVARVVWPLGSPLRHPGSWPIGNHVDVEFWLDMSRNALESGSGPDCMEFALRLALEHPERAGEALGPGWQWADAYWFAFVVQVPDHEGDPLTLLAKIGTVAVIVPANTLLFEIPPDFDAALQRARLIAAARQRIEEAARKA